MKEVTYEDWLKNPTPRMMWVWDSIGDAKEQRKVIYFLSPELSFPIVALTNDEVSTEHFRHCAEIEAPKRRRMTNKELSRWLREKPTREWRYGTDSRIYNNYTYVEEAADVKCWQEIVIRENDGEWREPLVEVEEND